MDRKKIQLIIVKAVLWLVTILSPLPWGGLGGGFLLCSCGEYWDGGEPVAARKMTLGRRAVNLMVGDRYRIPVIFQPDTLSNRSVFWMTEDEDVAVVENDTVVGLSQGLTRAYALSVSDLQTDTCWVNVLPAMYLNPKAYPYDMVIYADVTIHGHKYTTADEDSLIIAAYCFDELRGIGKMREWKGRDYMEIRVYSPQIDGSPVSLRCYYRGKGLVEVFRNRFEFNGEAYGTLSNLIQLMLDDNAEELKPYIPDDGNPYIDLPDSVEVDADKDNSQTN